MDQTFLPLDINPHCLTTNAAIESAYPTVQPMKAALYFESAKGMGPWRILIGKRMVKNLRETRRRDAETLKVTLKRIRELSKGLLSGDNYKRLNGPKSQVPIYEAKVTRDLRLVYQVDCIPDYDSDKVDMQVITIFGTYTHAQLDSRFWESVSQQLARKGTDYIHRCQVRIQLQQSGDSIVVPATFPAQPNLTPVEPSPITMELPGQDLDEIHSLLVLEKFVSVSQALLYGIFADQDVQHVFQMSRQEQDIIEHKYSCYVLGRSGTGKTTTMLFKMLGIERAWQMEADHPPKPRQLFVTKSSVLAGKVEEYFHKLEESLAMASLSPGELQKLAKSTKQDNALDALVNKEDQMNWQNRRPLRFSLLRDEHFPLFTTFDGLCKLLQGDIAVSQDMELRSSADQPDMMPWTSRKSSRQLKGTFVSYSVFRRAYWPHFPQTLTKGMDSFVVFNEFMGVIKGSEEALRHKNGILDRKTYENYSYRSQSTFASARNVVYTIFESYCKMKLERQEYDAADRIYTILTSVQVKGVPGRVDYLYVDEAQDNLLSDALLLRMLCRNSNGMFWAGDTAQTISAGSSFSFDELKAFLFRIEQTRQQDHFHTGLKREAPHMFQLLVNYRSHAGIINCAHSIVELITNFWPYAIDILAPEKGLVDGVKPVFFSGRLWDRDQPEDEEAFEKFLFGTTENHIEFGAQQCILVRDQTAMVNLQGRGITGSIMTLYDSKGLEFNDVLLYNFFRDSTVAISQWKVVLNGLDSRQLTVSDCAGLCSELKFLYVAITRARKNLWIVDYSEKSEPMRVFWSAKGLVRNCSPGMGIPHLAVASSREEWGMQGDLHFENEQYSQAIECFEKASMPDKAAVTRAYHCREEARMMVVGSTSRSKAFSEAARAFLECASSISAGRRVYMRTAADCYEQYGNHRRAARIYLAAEEYDLAAQRHCDCGEYGDAVNVVKKHKDMMDVDVVASVRHAARLFYFKEKQRAKAVDLFESIEDALAFTIEYDLEVAQLDLLVYMGKFADAGELHYRRRRMLDAIQLFIKRPEDGHSGLRAIQCILQCFWQNTSFRIAPGSLRSSEMVRQLLKAATQLHAIFWSPNHLDELSMFKTIRSGCEAAQLRQLGERFYYDHHNPTAAVLCLDHVFNQPNQIHIMTRCNAMTTVQTFTLYARILRDLALDPFPCRNTSVQRLFAFHELRTNVFLIPRQTHLHGLLNSQHTPILESNEAGKAVLGTEISKTIKKCLEGVLHRRVLQLTGELMTSMKEAEPWSLSASLIFLRQIIQQRLFINGAVLCDFIDCVCGSLVLSTHSQNGIILHDVTLPHNWLMLSGSFENGGKRDTGLLPILITPVGELLERIHSADADHITFDPGWRQPDDSVTRICRALCLLGYNIQSPDLRLEILRAISTLAQDDDHTEYVTSLPYIMARNWSDITHAVHTPATSSPSERIVQLCHISREEDSRNGVNQLFFENISDILPLLCNKKTARPTVKQPVQVCRALHKAPLVVDLESDSLADRDARHEAPENSTEIGTVQNDVADKFGGDLDSEPLADMETIEFGGSGYEAWGQSFNTTPSAAEVDAAGVIQNAYRRSISRRRGLSTGLLTPRARLFAACLAEAKMIQWTNGNYYKKVFLGPLPHVLLCLEEAKKCTASTKEQVKKRLKTAERQELEDLGKQQTEIASLLKRVIKLQTLLQPKAAVHRKQDMVTLAGYVSETEAIIRELPAEEGNYLQPDLAIAVKGILREQPAASQ